MLPRILPTFLRKPQQRDNVVSVFLLAEPVVPSEQSEEVRPEVDTASEGSEALLRTQESHIRIWNDHHIHQRTLLVESDW